MARALAERFGHAPQSSLLITHVVEYDLSVGDHAQLIACNGFDALVRIGGGDGLLKLAVFLLNGRDAACERGGLCVFVRDLIAERHQRYHGVDHHDRNDQLHQQR